MNRSLSSRTSPTRPAPVGLTQPSLRGNIVSDACRPAATHDLLRGTGLDPLRWDVPVPPVLQNAGAASSPPAVRPLPPRTDQPLPAGRSALGDSLRHGGGPPPVEQDPDPAAQRRLPTPGGLARVPASEPLDPLAAAVERARIGRTPQGPRMAPTPALLRTTPTDQLDVRLGLDRLDALRLADRRRQDRRQPQEAPAAVV